MRMNIEKNIYETFHLITRNKNFLNEVLVNISSVEKNYPNLVFHNRTRQDRLNKPLLDDLQRAAEKNNLKITVDYVKTGHGEETKTGNVSRHWKNSAVDIDFIYYGDKKYVVSPKNREIVEKFTDSLANMGYTKNSEGSSNPKAFLTFGFPDHDNHVHVSNTTDTPSTDDDSFSDEVKNISKQLEVPKDSQASWENLGRLARSLGPEKIQKALVGSTFGSLSERIHRIKKLIK